MQKPSISAIEAVLVATRTVSTLVQPPASGLRRRNLGWVRQVTGAALISLGLTLLTNGNAAAISFTFKKVVDTNTPIPGGTGTFNKYLSDPSLDHGNVAFLNFDDHNYQQGYYTKINGKLKVVADLNTPIPGGTGTFKYLRNFSLDHDRVAFAGSNEDYNSENYQDGIYTDTGGTLNTVVDNNTPIPGGTGTFESFGAPSLDNDSVAFIGFSNDYASGNYQRGIYTNVGGKLKAVADLNTPIPGATSNFDSFFAPSLDNGSVAFTGYGGYDSNLMIYKERGIYSNIGGTLAEVIAAGDLLDGKRVSGVYVGQEGLSGNQMAFVTSFENGSDGIYVATAVPEPPSALGTMAFGTFGASWILKRKLRQQKVISRVKNS